MPCELSTFSTTFSASSGRVKLGHPVPLSNLSKDAKSGSPETMSTFVPVFVGEGMLGSHQSA
ncbi:MAG TPA: hypothetical protein VN844_28930 [Pyrinomonadaceae bacterium]|nr:hypothetical protein [Pyrinomonadaceae bacterium]